MQTAPRRRSFFAWMLLKMNRRDVELICIKVAQKSENLACLTCFLSRLEDWEMFGYFVLMKWKRHKQHHIAWLIPHQHQHRSPPNSSDQQNACFTSYKRFVLFLFCLHKVPTFFYICFITWFVFTVHMSTCLKSKFMLLFLELALRPLCHILRT